MPNFIASLVRRSLDCVFEDWKMMIEVDFQIVGAKSVSVESQRFVSSAKNRPTIVMETMVEGACNGPLFIAFTEIMVAHVVGPMVMLSESAIEEKAETGLDEMDHEAFKEMANLLCGSSNRVFQDAGRDLRVSQSVDHLKLHSSREAGDDFLGEFPAGSLTCVQVLIEKDGKKFHLLQAMPDELAQDITDQFNVAA